MLQITCQGSHHEIGLKHGQEAKVPISRCIKFYASLFQETAKMGWDEVRALAMQFQPVIQEKWPGYLDEMAGVAEGAGVELSDIIALNVRTEITFGLFSDGCTALSWKTEDRSFLAQNWDWMEAQKANLVILTIMQHDKPTIKIVTEAGIIGKIGLNSAGVGVCLNAIKAKGVDKTRLPCHLGLRTVLECANRDEAVRKLEQCGIASACHMLVADPTGGVGLECSSTDLRKLDINASRQIFHSNHYLLEHPGVEESDWLEDSRFRVQRIEQLCEKLGKGPSEREIQGLFEDEARFPGSICRAQTGSSTAATLFGIVMDLRHLQASAQVRPGRPTAPEETIILRF